MRSFHNIERSAFRPGQYVGYSNGVWRIWRWSKRDKTRAWIAIRHQGEHAELFGRSLAEISAKLASA